MKKLLTLTICLLTILLQISGVIYSQSEDARQKDLTRKPYVEGELLVKFQDGSEAPAAARAHAVAGGTVMKTFPLIGWQLVKLPEGMNTEEGLAQYRLLGDDVQTQPNFIYRIDATPNDPQFGSLYGMTKISAPAAWDTAMGSAAVVVAVIDTGVDYNHSDLAANMWINSGEVPGNGLDDDANGFIDDLNGYDFYNNDANPFDDQSHGTHTAGTVGAVGNNGTGVVGVNWNVRLMALKTHSAGPGDSTAATVIAAFNYVTMMKRRGVNIRVTNNSWGGAPEAASYDQALKDAIDAAGNEGVLHVFSAGNSARNTDSFPAYPASYNSPSIISVAASDSNDSRSSFSNWGLTSVDLAAPGSNIVSTVPSSGYGSKSGTSMAAPHVAGAVALLAGHNPSLSAASVKATLINSVDPLAAFNGLVLSGGRLNVARALTQPSVCSFSLSDDAESFPVNGGQGSVAVTTQTNCGWMATSSVNWVTITSTTSGTPGSGSLNYSVAANPGVARSATLKIADKTVTISQSGQANADSDGDGIPDVVESAEGTNPLVKDNDIFTSARLFVMQQYRDFLGREGDAAGISFWTNQLTSGAQSRVQMVDTFFTSAEFSAVNPVTRLYFAYFLRIPDYDGLQFWVGQYRAGLSLEAISQAFASSAEFITRYGSLTNQEFVSLVYQNVLGRAADPGGLAYWTGQLNSGAMTRGQVMLAFSESAENLAVSFNRVFVVQIYVGMLRRSPDQGGFDFWLGALNGGGAGCS